MNNEIIRASFDNQTITVYQAFNHEIGCSAVANQTFVSPPFKSHRMTWIKPSFMWMMYRSGWATKENQEHILAIKIKRIGFEWALRNSCLSRYDNTVYSSYRQWKNALENSPVRIQWDPERDILMRPQSYKSIQIGLSGQAVMKYITDWITHIDDITLRCREIAEFIEKGLTATALKMLPIERNYPMPDNMYSTSFIA